MKAYIYTRISVDKKNATGYGEADQLKACIAFCKANGIEVVGHYMEKQSGKDANRPVLQEVLSLAKQDKDAVIMVSKLDRLSRAVADIAVWMREGVRFVVAELGLNVDNFMLHIRASFAELEREMIGARTKAALKQARERGVKLGVNNPVVMEGKRKQGAKTIARVLPHIKEARAQGITSYKGISKYLNAQGVPSARGGKWFPASVSKLMKRIDDEELG